MPLVEVAVDSVPAPHWITEITQRWDLRVRIEVCRPMGPDSSNLLQAVELVGNPGDLGAAERFLRRRPEIRNLTVLSSSPSRRFVRAVTPLPSACQRIFELGAICGSCQFAASRRADGKQRWNLVIPRTRASLRAAARAQQDLRGAPAQILRIRRFVPPRTLTTRQTLALETAYRLGFYAFPRRTNLQEVSRILGVSRSTTAELLRRAESKMLAQQIGES